MDVQSRGIFIISRQFEAARFKLLMINYQAGIFHVKDLHDIPPSVDENENSSATNILVHGVGYNAA
jgi:hypothetical protein